MKLPSAVTRQWRATNGQPERHSGTRGPDLETVNTGALLQIANLTIRYPGQLAVDAVDLEVRRGEILALLGENGSGKSTLIKAIAGLAPVDAGANVRVENELLAFGDPGAADRLGLRFVHQDLGLVGQLSVVDNLALGPGYGRRRAGAIHWAAERREATELMAQLGYCVDVRQPTENLSPSERTAIAVARALTTRRSEPKVLILDEPTANLHEAEVLRLLELMVTVAARGVAILWVSHYLPEVMSTADRAAVMRNGRVVATRSVSDTSTDELTSLLIGDLAAADRLPDEGHGRKGKVLLEAHNVSGPKLAPVDLNLHEGEIVGVAGLPGSGRETLAAVLFGACGRSGRVTVSGNLLRPGCPRQSMKLGAVYVPADRQASGAFLEHAAEANITIARPQAHLVHGVIRSGRVHQDAAKWMRRLSVRPVSPRDRMDTFSGGNQQKIILARALSQAPKLLILENPTQGVDLRSRAEIHALLREAAARGVGVLVASTDHEELATLCDRVLVMRAGAVDGTISRPELSAERLTRATQL
jgi:ribose transport system ATP-binding protein